VAEEREVLPDFVTVALYAALGLIWQAVFVFGGAMEVPFGAQDVQPPPGTPTEIFENVVVAAQVAALSSLPQSEVYPPGYLFLVCAVAARHFRRLPVIGLPRLRLFSLSISHPSPHRWRMQALTCSS
jgi:hypothetical protein